MIKTGNTVRFLNASGGGIVRKVVGNVAWVEAEDGFEIPTPINELVMVEENDTFIPAYKSPVAALNKKTQPEAPQPQAKLDRSQAEKQEPRSPRRINPKADPNAKLNVYLAYLPISAKHLMQNPFEAYIINDSDFTVHFSYANFNNGSWHLILSDQLEPHTKLFLEEFMPETLSLRTKVAVQLIAFRYDGSYILKSPISTEVRLEAPRFFKQSSFVENDFFEDGAIVFPIVKDDKPPFFQKIDKELLSKALQEKQAAEKPLPTKQSKPHQREGESLVIDLHAHELLDQPETMQPGQILQYQQDTVRRIMEEYKAYKGFRIVFIHGKGEGVLRRAVESLIRKHYPTCEIQDASFVEYGYGASLVTIH